jgi:hypothetical protein
MAAILTRRRSAETPRSIASSESSFMSPELEPRRTISFSRAITSKAGPVNSPATETSPTRATTMWNELVPISMAASGRSVTRRRPANQLLIRSLLLHEPQRNRTAYLAVEKFSQSAPTHSPQRPLGLMHLELERKQMPPRPRARPRSRSTRPPFDLRSSRHEPLILPKVEVGHQEARSCAIHRRGCSVQARCTCGKAHLPTRPGAGRSGRL